uniref:NADH dehydrogenase subunit 4L n=3 Tax=Phaedusinae TaxID=1290132 RepID=A0A347Z6H5_9EUPU|nr:NADH dehydrogenase subunit 4L [Stereophaedusa goniopoma]BBA10466.1 NADH dehydrogenase subunit 4L [Stereophaedusa japonica]BBA10472.1 NADH dehydrogenase subunit 4L [Phaedusa pallens]BBA10778.1 NADH dehydrogenase subunit 4L [Stereophaedusa goniopoma]
MMFFHNYLFLLMVLLLFFLFNTKGHLLRALLILEAMMLNALVISVLFLGSLQYEPFMFLFIMTFAVVEAGMGLSLLLTYMKVSGGDTIKATIF